MLRLLPASVLALALLLPAAASADSIVYTKAANVWVAAGDGSGQRPVTKDGTGALPYQSATQADDGTILAQRGTRFLRMDRNGNVIANLRSVLTDLPLGINAVGPFDPEISPDGTKVAYWIGMYSSWYDYGSNINWTRTGSVVIYQDARNGTILGVTHYYEEPSWLADSSRVLMFEETNGLTPQVMVGAPGQDHNQIQGWFGDIDTKPAEQEYWYPIGAGELNRAGNRLAVLRGGTYPGNGGMSQGSGNTIALYNVSSLAQLPAMWPCVMTGANGGEFGKPTWSPAGTALAFTDSEGIWTLPVGADCSSLVPRLAIPGGTQPDWGPAESGAGAPDSGPNPDPKPKPPALAVNAPGSISKSALRRRGLKITVTCPSACSATAVARRVGRARARLQAAGTATLKLRPRGRAARRLPRRLSVRVTVRPNGAAATTVVRRVRVR